MFIDYAKIRVKGGKGGDGCISFRREKYVPRGGPSGGDGGKGGSVIIKVDPQINTLLYYKYRKVFKAENGKPGQGKNKKGKDGKDLILFVPKGTIIKSENNLILADLDEDAKEYIAAKGGKGGRGNSAFATSTNQAPLIAEKGEEGEEKILILELKLIADVGLVGLPNAGKSTLLSVISEAKPKIGDYPFTTLEPMLGVVSANNYSSFVAADIPGIIEGSHQGLGLGLQFLRHIERTKILWILIDASSDINPITNLNTVLNELHQYSSSLYKKPKIILATKIDIAKKRNIELLKRFCQNSNYDFFCISAVANKGIKKLIYYTIKKLKDF